MPTQSRPRCRAGADPKLTLSRPGWVRVGIRVDSGSAPGDSRSTLGTFGSTLGAPGRFRFDSGSAQGRLRVDFERLRVFSGHSGSTPSRFRVDSGSTPGDSGLTPIDSGATPGRLRSTPGRLRVDSGRLRVGSGRLRVFTG
jgi:hypothetical protein